MKTLHVETGRHLYGGAQQVLYLLSGLRRAGIDVLLVAPPKSAVADAAGRTGIDVVPIECRGDLDLRFSWRLRRVLAEHRPDIVHCHSRRGGDVLGGRAAALAGVRAVVSRRVDNPDSGRLAALRYRPFRRVVAISEAIAARLREDGVDERKIVVIRSAVDAARFASGRSKADLCAEFGLAAETTLVLSAAQFIERKGQRHLLEALAAIAGDYPGLRVLMFGKGPDEAALRERARALGVADRVVFPGFRADLDDYLPGFDLLVHTATAEGLGVIVLKAQAAGVPVIAFAAGGVPEAVADGVTGTLVEAGNAERLGGAIARLLDDSERRARYADAARARARAEFGIQPMVDAHIRLYESVMRD